MLLYPNKERRRVSWSSKPCWFYSLEEWEQDAICGCVCTSASSWLGAAECPVTVTNVVATVGRVSWTVKSCFGRADGVPNLRRALNQPQGVEVSPDLPAGDAADGRCLQPAEGLRTSLCPGEGANPSSKPVSSARVHAQKHFPLGQILLLPRAWCKGLPVRHLLWSRLSPKGNVKQVTSQGCSG